MTDRWMFRGTQFANCNCDWGCPCQFNSSTTHFYVFNSTMTEVLDPIFAPIALEIDVAGRTASVEIPGIGVSRAEPIVDPNSGEEFRVGFNLPNGFQLTEAEVGSGSTDLVAGIELHLSDSHAHFAELHMNQDGVIR